jgi:hypothetical protein
MDDKAHPHEDRAEGDNDLQASEEKIAIISGVEFPPRKIAYYEIEGLAIFEGDIILGTADKVGRALKQLPEGRDVLSSDFEPEDLIRAVVISGARFRWPGARIPFQIRADVPDTGRITDAIEHWEDVTRLRFLERTPQNANRFRNFVEFIPAAAGTCQSAVGMQGGQQTIMLGADCTEGQVKHEIGHAVGLWHEQSREFREDFVTINWQNIQPRRLANFRQRVTDGDNVGPYDYGSIMHYGRFAWTLNGQETITPTDPMAVIGQRSGLSPGDIDAVHSIYPVTVEVPFVLNSPADLASDIVLGAGLDPEFDGPIEDAYVTRQTPRHGAFVSPGSRVEMGTRKGQTP